jgi:hypothetical protein
MPMRDTGQRITLIIRDETLREEHGGFLHPPAGPLVFFDGADALRLAVPAALTDQELDIERVIIDRTGTAEQLLEFLVRIPPQFGGDVLILRHHGGGLLSTTVRGGGRTLLQITPWDVPFYLHAHNLIAGALEATA